PAVEEATDHQAQEIIDAAADDDLLHGNTLVSGKGRTQLVALRIGVVGDLLRGGAHGLLGAWRRAKGALIRAEPQNEWAAAAALHGLRRDKGHCCWQARHQARHWWPSLYRFAHRSPPLPIDPTLRLPALDCQNWNAVYPGVRLKSIRRADWHM